MARPTKADEKAKKLREEKGGVSRQSHRTLPGSSFPIVSKVPIGLSKIEDPPLVIPKVNLPAMPMVPAGIVMGPASQPQLI
jgi:hypothetical protein